MTNKVGLFACSDVTGTAQATLPGNAAELNGTGVCINDNAGAGTSTVRSRTNKAFATNTTSEVTGGSLTKLLPKYVRRCGQASAPQRPRPEEPAVAPPGGHRYNAKLP